MLRKALILLGFLLVVSISVQASGYLELFARCSYDEECKSGNCDRWDGYGGRCCFAGKECCDIPGLSSDCPSTHYCFDKTDNVRTYGEPEYCKEKQADWTSCLYDKECMSGNCYLANSRFICLDDDIDDPCTRAYICQSRHGDMDWVCVNINSYGIGNCERPTSTTTTTMRSTTTTTQRSGSTTGKLVEGTDTLDLGLNYAGARSWDIYLSGYSRVGIGIYTSNDPTPNKYGGWHAYVEVNGDKMWENKGSEAYDYVDGDYVTESGFKDQYFDITNYVSPGKNTIKYYHYTDGLHGPKVTVHGGQVSIYGEQDQRRDYSTGTTSSSTTTTYKTIGPGLSGYTCYRGSDCLSGNCANGICCKVGELCCMTDEDCLGEFCGSEHHCTTRRDSSFTSTPTTSRTTTSTIKTTTTIKEDEIKSGEDIGLEGEMVKVRDVEDTSIDISIRDEDVHITRIIHVDDANIEDQIGEKEEATERYQKAKEKEDEGMLTAAFDFVTGSLGVIGKGIETVVGIAELPGTIEDTAGKVSTAYNAKSVSEGAEVGLEFLAEQTGVTQAAYYSVQGVKREIKTREEEQKTRDMILEATNADKNLNNCKDVVYEECRQGWCWDFGCYMDEFVACRKSAFNDCEAKHGKAKYEIIEVEGGTIIINLETGETYAYGDVRAEDIPSYV